MDVHTGYPEESEGLNNWIARETTTVPMSRYSRLHSAVHEAPSTLPNRSGSPFRSEHERDLGRAPSEKLGFHKWPLLKTKGSRRDVRGVFFGAKEPRDTSNAAHGIASKPKHLASQAIAEPKTSESLCSKKRKASVPDLTLGQMTTVYEGLLDSPTLPLHHPFLERSLSYPEFGLRRLSEEANEKTPRVSEFSTAESRQLPATSEMRKSWEKRGRRRSSVMMQKELMPLIIPSGSPARSVICEHRTARPDEQGEIPPQVPPKSPRTESRASPRPKQMAHSASSSTSTLHSISSSATSLSSVSAKCSAQPSQGVHQAGSQTGSQVGSRAASRAASPLPQRGGLTNGEGQPSGALLKYQDRFGRHTPPRAESPHTFTGAFVHQDGIGRQTPPLVRSLSSDPELLRSNKHHVTLASRPKLDRVGSSWMDLKREEPVKENKINLGHVASAKPLWHQRGNSEASALNRVRSTTKADSPAVHKLSRTELKGPTLSEEKTVLPTGFRVKEVLGKLRNSDLKELKKQADEQVMTFEILSVKDVSNLSKELSLLNERCEYLHRTHTSLRQGRNGLHSRMILYLKTPQLTTKFSRESILKQEEALSELDVSIDEWASKLEHAQDRRNQIQQKLLQHYAAASNLPTTQTMQSARAIETTLTPPTSPENTEDVYSRQRQDVQSIKIYADSGVAALLSAIEQEIDLANPANLSS